MKTVLNRSRITRSNGALNMAILLSGAISIILGACSPKSPVTQITQAPVFPRAQPQTQTASRSQFTQKPSQQYFFSKKSSTPSGAPQMTQHMIPQSAVQKSAMPVSAPSVGNKASVALNAHQKTQQNKAIALNLKSKAQASLSKSFNKTNTRMSARINSRLNHGARVAKISGKKSMTAKVNVINFDHGPDKITAQVSDNNTAELNAALNQVDTEKSSSSAVHKTASKNSVNTSVDTSGLPQDLGFAENSATSGAESSKKSPAKVAQDQALAYTSALKSMKQMSKPIYLGRALEADGLGATASYTASSFSNGKNHWGSDGESDEQVATATQVRRMDDTSFENALR